MLTRENEELKSRNQILESQLKAPLDHSKMNAAQTEDKTVDPVVLEELSNNLQTATDVCEKVKQDMEKLKEVRVSHCRMVLLRRGKKYMCLRCSLNCVVKLTQIRKGVVVISVPSSPIVYFRRKSTEVLLEI